VTQVLHKPAIVPAPRAPTRARTWKQPLVRPPPPTARRQLLSREMQKPVPVPLITELCQLVDSGCLARVSAFLLAHPDLPLNAPGERMVSPLQLASGCPSSLAIVRVLLSRGASPHYAVPGLDATALHAACAALEAERDALAERAVELGTRLRALSGADAERRALEVEIDLEKLKVTAGKLSLPVTMKVSAQQGLLSGRYDAIADLLANLPKVQELAARLG